TPAFAWLQNNAHTYGFRMSYGHDNPHALVYEPWHWNWRP
ncbi:MAG: D-alanyl-D-alanine carboxypeptidase family protein, partial [Verrucomicrobia bacterium]|nr:D-alanyl-D-alanine carboxypeptidase family protein [Verrucomicrobiota bacterium]